jgi:LacI family transcriptional regulator
MPPSSNTTLKQIAEQLGVSVTTVSHSLNGQARRYRISPRTEKAVKDLARTLGYAPSQLARELRSQKSATIGLVIPDISNPFCASVARRVILGAREQGYSTILCDSQEDLESEIKSIAILRSRQVEGIVVCPIGLVSNHLMEVGRAKVPIVLVDRVFPDLPLPYVTSDNFSGARNATQYLIKNGHHRIVCLQGMQGTSVNDSRVKGYRQALADNRIAVDKSLIVGNSFSEQGAYIETKLVLRMRKKASAILALGNQIMLGALRAMTEEKLKIPTDISLVAFDDQPYAEYLTVPITGVAQARSEIGKVAVKLLLDQIRAPSPRRKGGILLPTKLIIRRSVKKLK